MPIYEYACEKCGHEFEAEQRITDAPIKSCPSCRARKVKRLISQTSFVLKGGGWYSDLYSSGKPKTADKSGDKGAPSDDKGGGKGAGDKGSAESSKGKTGKGAKSSKATPSGDKTPKAAA